MRDLLHDLRSIVEHERTVYGSLLPLDAPDEAARSESAARPNGEHSTEETPPSEPPRAADTNASSPEDASPETALSDTEASSQDEPAAPASTASASTSDSTTQPDDSSTDPMPNKDLFGNRTRPPEDDPTLPPWKRIDALVPDDAPYKDAETLEEVEDYLASNVLVPIDEDRENPVFGVGDPHADLVIIGEARPATGTRIRKRSRPTSRSSTSNWPSFVPRSSSR